MYIYDAIDQGIVDERVAQFRDQTQRFLAGELAEDDYRPLRLQNGLYVQRFAPMLRVAIPYGLLASRQMRALAEIARRWDRGYGHFSTRQNIQFNWPKLEDVPEILAHLATVQMHAIQTSGNCIRNTTTDHFAGVAADEIVDPLVWCELIRQWSTLHPEFAYLPRKFKIAVSGATQDRAAIQVHDIGLQVLKNAQGEIGFKVLVGGGLGRTPVIGVVINEFLPWQHLLTYLEAILRVYNRYGRRDNKYKAGGVCRTGECRVGALARWPSHLDCARSRARHSALYSPSIPTPRGTAGPIHPSLGARARVWAMGPSQRASAQGCWLCCSDLVAEENRCPPRRCDGRANGRNCRLS
jgi:sulfite reductase (NADPH) hemoprotein beta-component